MAKKKEKKKSLIERLSQVNRKTWRVILVIAIAVMVIPVILDILLPETGYDSSVVSPEDLIVIRDDADLLTEEEEKRIIIYCGSFN